jgi:hypothetical protein
MNMTDFYASMIRKRRTTWIIIGSFVAIAGFVFWRYYFQTATQGVKAFDDKKNGNKSNGVFTLPNGTIISSPYDTAGFINIERFGSIEDLVAFNSLDGTVDAAEAAAQIRFVLEQNFGFTGDITSRCTQLKVLLEQSDEFIRKVNNHYRNVYQEYIEETLDCWLCRSCDNNAAMINKLKYLH